MSYASATSLAKKIGSHPQAVIDAAADLKLGKRGVYKNSPIMLDEQACQQIHLRILENKLGDTKAAMNHLQVERLKVAKHMGYLANLARSTGHPAAVDLEELERLTSNIPEAPREKDGYKARVDFVAKAQTLMPRIAAIQDRISKLL
jgi:hypothetical protein